MIRLSADRPAEERDMDTDTEASLPLPWALSAAFLWINHTAKRVVG